VQNRFRNEAQHEMTGAVGLRRVPKQFLENYILPLPPLPDQHAIVSKIEELLSELDKGKQQLELAQQQLKVYRQAVLKWAFEGKLTGGQEGWTQTRLGDLANAIDPQPSHRTPPIVQGGIPFVSIKDFDSESDKIDFTKARLVSNNVLKEHLDRYRLKQGDFVIGKIGTIGKPVRIVLPQNYALSANIVLIQPRKIDATFLYYFFQSSIIEKAFLAGTRATTQAAFGIQKVRELEIQLPPAKEQQLIVQEIESRLSVCDKVEETITQSLAQAETLRQSILKKAFEGKLVTEIESENIQALSRPMAVLPTAAEALTKYTRAATEQFPKVIDGIKDTDLHAGILAMVIDAHEKSPEHHLKLSHVKGEKIAHLVEAHIGIDLGRNPRKDAAGPDDYPHLKKVESRASKAGWFAVKKLRIGQTYVSKSGMPKIIDRIKKVLSTEDINKVEELIQTFLPFELEHAEVIATLYAGWNNLLLEGKKPTEEDIVFESRENWSKRKLGIERKDFFKALNWMKERGYVPSGLGKKVKSGS
jgi:type I restriction enzyme S subunit